MKKLVPALILLALLSVIFGVPFYATAAQLPCTITIGAAGNVIASCAGSAPAPAPTPAPAPAPTPQPTPPPVGPGGVCVNSAGQSIPQPANMKLQTMYAGGTNNYVFDSNAYTNPSNSYPGGGPTGTIQVFELPKVWSPGNPITQAQVQFASFIVYSGANARYEVAFSRCKGDFDYYKTDKASVSAGLQKFQPCGIVWGSDMGLGWSIGEPSIYSCAMPAGETWYMNWRVVPGTCNNGPYTCGQTFYVPRG